jgi:hypothetical protein
MATASCGVHTQSSPTRLDDDNVRVAEPTPATTGTPGSPTDRAELCYVSGDRLITIVRVLPAPLSAHRALEALDNVARAGLPVGIRSAIRGEIAAPDGAVAARGIARVELDTDFLESSPPDRVLALAQIVCTLTSLPGVGQVQFTHLGEAIEIPRADGSRTREPVSRFDYRSLLPAA